MGNVGLELPFKDIKIFRFPTEGVCRQGNGRDLRPRDHPSRANWRQLGEIDVTPKAGMAERGLTPSTTDMRNV